MHAPQMSLCCNHAYPLRSDQVVAKWDGTGKVAIVTGAAGGLGECTGEGGYSAVVPRSVKLIARPK